MYILALVNFTQIFGTHVIFFTQSRPLFLLIWFQNEFLGNFAKLSNYFIFKIPKKIFFKPRIGSHVPKPLKDEPVIQNYI